MPIVDIGLQGRHYRTGPYCIDGNSIDFLINTISSGNNRTHLLNVLPDTTVHNIENKQRYNLKLENTAPSLTPVGKHVWDLRTLARENIIRLIHDTGVMRWVVYHDKMMVYLKSVFTENGHPLLTDPAYEEYIRLGLADMVSGIFGNVQQYIGVPIERNVVFYPSILLVALDVWVFNHRESFTAPSPLIAFTNVLIHKDMDFPTHLVAHIVQKDLEKTLATLLRHPASQSGVKAAYHELEPRMKTRYDEFITLGYLIWGNDRLIRAIPSPLAQVGSQERFHARDV